MKQKTIKFKNSKNTIRYLKILNGVFDLSPKEMEILAAFIDLYNELKDSGFVESPFDNIMRRKVAEKLGVENYNHLNSTIQRIRKKGAIQRDKQKGKYIVNPIILPQGESEIVFKLS